MAARAARAAGAATLQTKLELCVFPFDLEGSNEEVKVEGSNEDEGRNTGCELGMVNRLSRQNQR